jgi:hypothetical protein
MHAAALIELLHGGGSERSFQKVIAMLSSAALQSPEAGPVLADLSAAYLLRGDARHTPRDWVASLDAAERALQEAPRNRAALFNRALALQRFGAVDRTQQAWREYLSTDTTSLWAQRARQNLLALQRVRAPVVPSGNVPDASYAAFARADPQAARELGFCRELGEWGGAVLGADSAGARAHLARAEVMGVTLIGRRGGDHSLHDAVLAIGHASPDASAALARAHRDSAEG